MNRIAIVLATVTVFLASHWPGVTYSQGSLSERLNPSKDDPIEISSDRMRSDDGGQKIIFSGNVEGKWGELLILADVLEVYSPDNNTKTDEIIAIGHVKITRGEKKATGDRAVYMDKAQKIILTGNPKAVAWEGKNTVEGREMIFLLDSDLFVINERVRMKIFPKKEPGKSGNN